MHTILESYSQAKQPLSLDPGLRLVIQTPRTVSGVKRLSTQTDSWLTYAIPRKAIVGTPKQSPQALHWQPAKMEAIRKRLKRAAEVRMEEEWHMPKMTILQATVAR